MSECPYCQTTEHQIKAGRTGADSIRIILLASKALYIHDIHHFPILNQVHRIKRGFRLVAAAAFWALLSCQPERCEVAGCGAAGYTALDDSPAYGQRL